VVDRDRFFLKRCQGKRVLHVGCSDAPFTKEKYFAGDLLHSTLQRVTSELAGLDYDEESVSWLRQQGMANLHVGDATQVESLIKHLRFDPQVIVAGEVLEHLGEPLAFLRSLRLGTDRRAVVLLSVPNAFHFQLAVRVATGREKVHPEHVAYYSFWTIRQLMERAGFVVRTIHPCTYRPRDRRGRWMEKSQRLLLCLSPHLAQGYVLSATPTPAGQVD
jgi:2-polyprenyl-3-methyl-5-hydroxy-6-metoxy-1,4-benzoquinol methylase